MKKILSLAMILTLILSMCAVSYAAPVRASDESTAAQLKLLFSGFDAYRQSDGADPWLYTVTDLDHNGRLELLAASEQGGNKYTSVKVWEVNEDGSSASECKVTLPEDESFPDILTENADTYYDAGSDTWYYMFYDKIVLSEAEAYYARCRVTFQDGALGFQQLAVQHTMVSDGVPVTVYMDNSGTPISSEQYNDSGTAGSAEMIRSSTNFDWIGAADVAEERLTDCYAVFKGVKQPPEKEKETAAPAAASTAEAAPASTSAPVPAATPVPTVFMTISKNPTNESRTVGETAWFVSGASGYTSLSWTFVSPNGGEFSVQSFRNSFPSCTVNGENSTTLTVGNLSLDMSGWGVFCTFYNYDQTARTNTAFMYVSVRQTQTQAPAPTQNQTSTYTTPSFYSSYYGQSVYDFGDGTFLVENADGSGTYYDNDGSWTDYDGNYSAQHFSDGSTFTDFGDGSYLIDNGFGSATYIDQNGSENFTYIPEIYSNYYGWGSYY